MHVCVHVCGHTTHLWRDVLRCAYEARLAAVDCGTAVETARAAEVDQLDVAHLVRVGVRAGVGVGVRVTIAVRVTIGVRVRD